MSDWDDGIQDNGDASDDCGGGRDFGRGRGFVPKRTEGWNDRSDFDGGNRGRGGRGGRGGNRGDDRRGRGGGRGRDNRRDFDEGEQGESGGWGSGDTNDNRRDNEGENGEPEQRPEPVTYVPKERTEDELLEETGIQKGINFRDYDNIPVNVDGKNVPQPINSFDDARFRDLILSNLRKCKYDKPTPIQKHAIPVIMAGRDLMATAQTGSGKTAAFLLPIIHQLLSNPGDAGLGGSSVSPQALILSPTRELAIQIYENARIYTLQSSLKVAILYGGTATRYQSSNLARGCHILIATPGRLMDFLQREYLRFDAIQFLVLDEADRMLDMGFVSDIQRIVNHNSMTPKESRQTLMFSATFSQTIQRLAAEFLRDYVFVAVGIVGGACKDVEQNFIPVQSDEKRTKLLALLEEQDNVDGTLLFVEQKRVADFLASFLCQKKYKTTSIHGDRQQFQREEALRDFKTKRMSILVATNVAARGLDIQGVKHVINYDLPKETEEYIHRIGRTGRLGNKGKATSLYDSSKDSQLADNLVKILKEANQKIPDFIEQDATGMGDYESGAFGGRDYRKDDGFKSDGNQPTRLGETEEW